MAYPDGTEPIDETVHPTPIYETLAMGLVAYLLWRWRDRFQTGVLFAIYLVLAGAERLLVEFIRRNDARPPRAHPGPAAQPGDDRRRRRLARREGAARHAGPRPRLRLSAFRSRRSG